LRRTWRGRIPCTRSDAAPAGDITTRKLLEGILGDEEAHADTFRTMLGR
jgi:bacterioferritin (cytochrome b1)